jgi:FkbM family methyltransferase
MKSFSHYDSSGVELDKKLDNLFQHKEGGFFIELGANDGLSQSNTAMLEFERNWNGILIEPSLSSHILCKKNRPNSISLNYACVSNEFTEDFILGDFNGGLMASVGGLRVNNQSHVIQVPAITLEKIIDQHAPDKQIDLLSLDTEGYELNILKGLNLNKYRPSCMLIEVYTKDYDELVKYLGDNNYSLHSNFSNYSLKTNPGWDGTHNDYLFYDNLNTSIKRI